MYKFIILSAILGICYAAPGHLGYGGGDYGGHHTQLVAIKPVVEHVTVAKTPVWNPWQQNNNGWNPWQQNNAWNPWQQNNAGNLWQQNNKWNPWQQNTKWNSWQQNNGWNPWQQNNKWNPWQQNNAWNPWNQGYGSGGHGHSPATSYAQVTSYKVQHVQPVVKAIVPTYAHDYGYGHHR